MSLAVVGTDTGVGKTVVTAGLVRWLRRDGVDAAGVKPCQTGYPEDDDAGFVRAVCGDADAATVHRTLEPPLAPAVAAERTDRTLSYEAVLADCRRSIESREAAVVEGIGGLRVPLADGRDVLDLVADLGLPAVVVARPDLGTLNHTALTVAALRDRGVPVRGVVLSGYEGSTVAQRTNPEVIARENGVRVATLPRFDTPEVAARAVPDHVPPSFLPERVRPSGSPAGDDSARSGGDAGSDASR